MPELKWFTSCLVICSKKSYSDRDPLLYRCCPAMNKVTSIPTRCWGTYIGVVERSDFPVANFCSFLRNVETNRVVREAKGEGELGIR